MSETKSQSLYPRKEIRDLLVESKNCWPVRFGLYELFFNAYIETEKSSLEESSAEDFKHIISIMVDDFKEVSKILTTRTAKDMVL
jgi:hypothetical protein